MFYVPMFRGCSPTIETPDGRLQSCGSPETAKGEFHFVDVHVGARLRRRREFLGMKIQDLAALTGISFQQIHKSGGALNRIAPSRLISWSKGSFLNLQGSLSLGGRNRS